MSHYHIDGTIKVAKLKRRLIGGAVYTDVALRENAGSERRIGTLMVLDDMKHAMVPGGGGRFYFHDVLGTKGVHGFRPIGGQARGSFPGRWEAMFLTLGLLNLALVAGWLMLDGRIAWLAACFGLASMVTTGLFAATRMAAMRAYRDDDPRIRADREPRAASAPA